MYRFYSSIDKTDLDKEYKNIYSKAKLKDKWDNEVKNCPDLLRTLPTGIAPLDLLTLPYEKLVEVYLLYQQIYAGLSGDGKSKLQAAAERVFTYESYKKKIAQFLINEANGFKIYNCVYCDLIDVRPFGRNRQFDTEHILDKGNCPLVGLSLYNFCPACGTCNTNCKKNNPIGKTKAQMKKLSPTGSQYDFEHQVRFVLIEKPEALGRIKVDHPEWYDVAFDYKDADYQEVVELFDLVKRYNLPQNKLQAIEWRAKAKKNRGITLTLTALIHRNTKERELERVFHLDEHRKVHSERLKLMIDMMHQ